MLIREERVQFRNHKIVYRRYAGLFFTFCVDANDNELIWLEAIHLFVEVLGQSPPLLFLQEIRADVWE